MFNQKLKREIDYQACEIKDLRDKYWELLAKYDKLLQHLNLKEVTIPAKTIYENTTDD